MEDGSPLNPYQACQSSDLSLTGDRDLSNLTVVATILLSMAMLTLAVFAGSLAFNLALGIGFDVPPGFDGAKLIGFRMGQIGSVVVPLFCQLLTVVGAIAMIRRKQAGLAWAGAVAAIIPLCGPCFGLSIPFAIWAMVLLQRPAVAAVFRANASIG